jgi:primase-polymerase (primpol)-like protein
MTIDVERLPVEIRESVRAVVWKREFRAGKATKVPYCPHRPAIHAAVNDPASWGSFAVALATCLAGLADGPGIVLGDGLVGVDLDHCRETRTGVIEPAAVAIVRALDSYTEVSPSGTGLHVLARGILPPGRRRTGTVEMYSEGRYFTVTGEHVAGTPRVIHERAAALAELHRRLFGMSSRPAPRRIDPDPLHLDDGELLERAHAARNGAKFAALWRGDTSAYPSPSEADQALSNLLAFWTRGDAARIDRLFRRSGLFRTKWDTRRGEETYGARTIATAIAGCVHAYSRRGVTP